MAGYDKYTREHQVNNLFFIHNCFGSFFSGILNWFADEFYPRFNYKVIGTYDKACEFFKKQKELGTEVSTNLLPSITLDPMLDFSNADQGGRFLWQHSRYAPIMGLRLWRSVDLKEQNLTITPVFSRYQGTFEVTFWLSSIYELMDFRVALLQFTGGFNRWCRPEFFWTYLILPEEVENYEKQDGYKIDWGNTLSDVMHVNTINKHRRVLPITIDPIWRLESFSDSSTKYGGDTIAEYKLSASFGYEVNLPTYIVTSENIDPQLTLNLSLGSTYSKYPLVSPYKILQVIEGTDLADKYMDKNFNLFKIEDDIQERDNLILQFNENSCRWPEKLNEWNHIVAGTFLYVDDEFIANPDNRVHRDNIVLIDQYKEEFLPYIRRACAVISMKDTKATEFYHKCDIMKKPCVCNLLDEEKDVLLTYIGEHVTLDSRRRRIYRGLLSVLYAEHDDPVAAYNALQDIKREEPEKYKEAVQQAREGQTPFDVPEHRAKESVKRMFERVISDFADGIQTDFALKYILDSKNAEGLLVYVDDNLMKQGVDYQLVDYSLIKFTEAPERGAKIYLGGEYLVIKESKLVAIYEFTPEDVQDIENPIHVDLPMPIDRKENIILVSYTGKLEYEKDYDLDFENAVAILKIKPIAGEIVQFFYYV